MAYSLSFGELAQKQIIEALDYYSAISESLGQRFEDDLLGAYDALKQHPHHYFNLNKRFRGLNLYSFPYQLIYTVIEKDNEVLIAALFHQHTDPNKIKKLK